MKHATLLIALICFFTSVSIWAAPIEFFATVVGDPDDGDESLTVKITDTVTITVLVTGFTEIKNEDGTPTTLGEIDDEDMVEVEAIFTSDGMLALEIQIQDRQSRFELQGPLEGVDESQITVNELDVEVDGETEIKDRHGEPLTLEELEDLNNSEGPLWVKVEGMTTGGGGLLADEIKVLPDGDFARISLEGIVIDFSPVDNQMTVDIGGTPVLVGWTKDTKIHGNLGPGVFVKVKGVINTELFVTALTIRVQDLCELSPDELEMGFNESRPVTVLLRQALPEEITLLLVSQDPSIALPSQSSLPIPAGDLSGTFTVGSFGLEGKTIIEVTLPGGVVKTLKVEVGEDAGEEPEPKDLEIMWTPRVINSAPKGGREVRLMLKHGFAREDLIVAIGKVESSADLMIKFPEEATILQGEREVRIMIVFESQVGSGKLRATLPVEDGEDPVYDDLRIDLKSK